MDNIDIKLNVGELKEILKKSLTDTVEKSITKNKQQIESSLDNYFQKKAFQFKESEFESSVDWAVEACLREGMTKAMEDLNFKEMIAEKAKEILSSDNFIKELAENKVRSSLGLPLK